MTISNSIRSTVFILGALLFSNQASSLSVTNTSSCTDTCGGDGVTLSTDLICTDASFNDTAKGLTMKNCLLCESTSTTYNGPTSNDIYWFLFNQKYLLQDCLFDREPDVSLSPCESSCLPLRSVFKTLWFQDGWIPQYEYCDMGGGALETYAGDCVDCLRGKTGSVFLGNFMDTLYSGCQNKPNASDGETVKLRQPLFSTGTSTTSTATASARATETTGTKTTTSGTSATSAPDADTDKDKQSDTQTSGLSTGAKAGIGIGAAAGGLIVIAGLIWMWFLRRRRAQTSEKGVSKWTDESESVTSSGRMYGGPLTEMPVSEFTMKSELQGTARAELPGS